MELKKDSKLNPLKVGMVGLPIVAVVSKISPSLDALMIEFGRDILVTKGSMMFGLFIPNWFILILGIGITSSLLIKLKGVKR